MTCRRPGGCGHEFCWLCLADFQEIQEGGNAYHHTTCRHYRPEGGAHDEEAEVGEADAWDGEEGEEDWDEGEEEEYTSSSEDEDL